MTAEVSCGRTLMDALIDLEGLNYDREPFECDHAEHWASVTDDGWLDWNDAPAECRWARAHIDCVLPAGHSGDHAFDWPVTRGIEWHG